MNDPDRGHPATDRRSHRGPGSENSGTGVLTAALDLDALAAVAEAATELWTWHETYDDTLPGWGAHMGQMLYRLPRDGQTDDMKTSILAMVAALDALIAEAREARRLRGDVAALAKRYVQRRDSLRRRASGKRPADNMDRREANTWDVAAEELRALIGGGR